MFELSKLDDFFKTILCCPNCKDELKMSKNGCYCKDCGILYPAIGGSYNFLNNQPVYCSSFHLRKWRQIQAGFESSALRLRCQDQLSLYLRQIDSVKEIYQKEFNISGVILDVGGEQGTLRHFLNLKNSANRYCCIDPFVEVTREAQLPSSLASAYPCLKEPLNFVGGTAERLPFQSKKFDYVHMRSVLDHFYDPYIALKEAYRVLKPGGKLLVGLSVTGGKSFLTGNKIARLKKNLRDHGILKTISKVVSSILRSSSISKKGAEHMYQWRYEDLISLLNLTGFQAEKIHWQKPPFDHCVYILSRKLVSDSH